MITVFGSINLDIVIPVSTLPAPGETVLGAEYSAVPGGKGGNQALAAARDGARVAMVGAVGDDSFASMALAELIAAGVDLEHVARTAAPTGFAAITVAASGENQITVASGANALVTASQVPDSLLGPDATLVLQREVSGQETARLIERARALGTRVILNLAPALPLDDAVMALVDVLVVNEGEAQALAERSGVLVERLAARLGVTVLETRGAEGAIWRGADGAGWSIGAIAIRPIDTTAAGDAFVGVLAAGIDRGLTPPEALRRAGVAAGLSCTRSGAQTSLPSTAEIDAELPGLAPARAL